MGSLLYFVVGDFAGGALVFDDGTRIEEKYTWHKINGQFPRWNREHRGNEVQVSSSTKELPI
jgi:hypothetical protein